MASSMSPELQKTFENTWAYEMNQQVKEMFQAKASKERLDVVKSLMACKLKPEASICAFVLEMKGYFDRLESLNMMFDAELSINIILSGIKKIDVPSTSSAFVLTVGHNAKKINTFHSNWKGKAAKGKSDCGSNRKAESEIAPTNDPKEAVYLYCNTKGHWKRSCPKHLKDLKDGKVEKGSHSGLKESRRLKHIELNLVMGKRKITPVTRIGKYELMLKSGHDDISLPISRTSGRVSKPPQFYYGFHIKEDKISDSTLSELDEPTNYKEAMASPEAAKWKEAMRSKIQSMYDNQVWNLVDTTLCLKTVGCKWIFKNKTDMDGKVHTYKARLVEKGYTQTHRIDYEETFSPLAKIKSIRIMLSIVVFHDYEIWHMDVKTAFLNKKLIEDVFMTQPEDFENANRSVVVFLVLYVDDILLIRNDIPTLHSVKDWLGKCFAMKDLGDEAYILGIKIYRDRSKRLIGLSQDTRVPYALAIGLIMYAMTCTRPDVSFALSMVSRHQQNPGEGHWITVKNILKFLRNTKDMFLVYGGEEELRVTSYYDASWQTDKDHSHSQSGWVFLLKRGVMTWKISKQDTVADSTCESGYIAACEASKEDIWMKNFIGDLGFVPTIQDPIEIFCDNESAVALTKEPKDHEKSKNIERKYHFVRSKVE
ncbi:putative RNA-directed DNA polymerase [Tanacetum coccineum]